MRVVAFLLFAHGSFNFSPPQGADIGFSICSHPLLCPLPSYCYVVKSFRRRGREEDDGSEDYFWFDLSYISSASCFIHDRREPGDACLSSSTLKRGRVQCSLRHDAVSNLISLSTRSVWGGATRVRRRVPTSMTSSLGKARGLVAQSSFLLLPLIKFVLGALRSALILCLPGMCFQLPWTGLPGRHDVVEAAGCTCGLTRMKDVAPWTLSSLGEAGKSLGFGGGILDRACSENM